MNTLFGAVTYSFSKVRWQKVLEDFRLLVGLLTKVQLVIFDGLTKERCIALLAKEVYRLKRKSGILFTIFYLQQCSSSLFIAYGGVYKGPDFLSVPLSLSRLAYYSSEFSSVNNNI